MKTHMLVKVSRLGGIVVTLLMVAMSMSVAFAKPPSAAKADLTVSMSDSPDPARTGSTVTYSILASNSGPSQATGVKVTDSFPSEASVVSAKASRGSCDVGSQIVCSVGNVVSGETVEVLVELRSYTEGSLANTVSVTAEQNDPARSNNSASTATEIYDCYSCPTVTITDTPDPATAGEVVVYNIKGSASNSSAMFYGTQIVMRLPEGTEFVGATTFSCCTWVAVNCSYADRTVTCGGGTSPQANIVVRPLEAGSLTATAELRIKGFSTPMASASTVTTVGPPLAPGMNTPAPVFDQVENQSEAVISAVEETRDTATRTANQVKQMAENIAENLAESARQQVCKLTCRF